MSCSEAISRKPDHGLNISLSQPDTPAFGERQIAEPAMHVGAFFRREHPPRHRPDTSRGDCSAAFRSAHAVRCVAAFSVIVSQGSHRVTE